MAQTSLGLRFAPVPGPSSSDDQALGEHGRLQVGAASYPPSQPLGFLGVQWACLLRCGLCLFWGADLWLRPSSQMLTVQNPKKSWLATEPACSLESDASLGLPEMAEDGPVCSRLALLSPLFCEQTWRCLRAFPRIAIPQSGLLSQVSSLRLPRSIQARSLP